MIKCFLIKTSCTFRGDKIQHNSPTQLELNPNAFFMGLG